MISYAHTNRMLGFKLLSAYPNISHFVTTRHGGVSQGTYASFNCSPYVGDDETAVGQNQERLFAHWEVKPNALLLPRQVHDTEHLSVDAAFLADSPARQRQQLEGKDALSTCQPLACLAVSTADCVPLLFYHPTAKVVAAVHAGWRGTVAGITHRVVRDLEHRYGLDAQGLLACIGPSISPEVYEVGEEVYTAFAQAAYPVERLFHWHASKGKFHLDLWEANRLQLLEAGVPASQIEVAGLCTYTHHDTFFSARRLGIHSGRILSGIMLHD